MNTVKMATTMKVQVAASERLENSDRPQMPWPLVQPVPRTVPMPTMRPPAIVVSGPPLKLIEEVSKKNSPDQAAPMSIPIMKISRQLNSVSKFKVSKASKNATRSGDAAMSRHEENGRKPNERST